MEILEESEMDVLLADIAMPEEDGYALIDRFVRRLPATLRPSPPRPSRRMRATTSAAARSRPAFTCIWRSRSNRAS